MHALYREEHPLVFVITHWINLLAMFFLTLSGLYIHYPVFAGFMGWARGAHFFWMFVVIINLTLRIILAFVVKDANMPASRDRSELDIKNFVPQAANRHQLWPTIKYYLFLKKEHPIQAKYNPLQKVAYLATIVLTFAAAYTGFALWGPTSDWGFFQAGTDFVATWFNAGGGGDPMPMRILHYYIMWTILVFTAIHAYLANIYGFEPSRMIFAWKEYEPEHHA